MNEQQDRLAFLLEEISPMQKAQLIELFSAYDRNDIIGVGYQFSLIIANKEKEEREK